VRLLAAAVLTCVVALANGFPLSYPDTGNYVDNAADLLQRHEPWFFFRPLTYGMILTPFATQYTFWLIPLAQGLLVAWVADLALRAAGAALSSRGFVALFAALCAGTSLPWFSGQVMPDIFTSLVILLCFVVTWGAGLARWERWTAVGLLAVAAATHLSHLPLAAGVLLVAIATRLWRRPPTRLLPVVARGAAALLLAALITAAPNYVLYGTPVLSRSSSLFALARLVGDSLAQPYLDRVCPEFDYLLCAERGRLPAEVDWFLWSEEGPRARYQAGMEDPDSRFLAEAGRIVRGTIREEFPALVGTTLRKTVAQLASFGLAEGEHSYSPTVERAVERLGAGVRRGYLQSAQARDGMAVRAASVAQYLVVALSAALLAAWGVRGRRRATAEVRALVTVVFAGVILNALILASLARVHPRYQSRVIWLVPFAAAAAMVDLRRFSATARREP
jgi:hypothetical protein